MPKKANNKLDGKKQDNKKQDKKNKRHFMKDFKAELKRVIWPTPKQLLNNTVAVITVVLITAAIVFVLDLAFESMNTYGIEKLKEMVGTTNTIESNSVDNTDTNTADTNTVATNEVSENETENAVSEDANSVEE